MKLLLGLAAVAALASPAAAQTGSALSAHRSMNPGFHHPGFRPPVRHPGFHHPGMQPAPCMGCGPWNPNLGWNPHPTRPHFGHAQGFAAATASASASASASATATSGVVFRPGRK